METDHNSRPKNPILGKIIKRLMVAGACGGLAAFVLMAIIIVPDQVRSVPVVSTSQDIPGIRAEASPDTGDDDRYALSRQVRLLTDGHATSSTTRQAIMESVRLFPDLSIIPDDALTSVAICNQVVDHATSGLLTLLMDSEGMTYSEFWRQAQNIYRRRYEEGLDESTPVFKYLHNNHPDKACTQSVRDQVTSWETLLHTTMLHVADEKEKWGHALDQCATLSAAYYYLENDTFGRDPYWWDNAIRYARRDGLTGRTALAYATLRHSPLKGVVRALDGPVLRPMMPFVERTLRGIDGFLWKSNDDE